MVASASTQDVASMEKDIKWLKASNEVLIGVASKLQKTNKSLENQLLVQHDKLNFLNLNLGGVEEVAGVSCKKQAVKFFRDVLGIKDVTESDFVQAYRRSSANTYEEHLELKGGEKKTLTVHAPGVMFVRLASENLRQLAVSKARALKGKRHPTKNHKYFATPITSEASKATKEKHHNDVQTILNGNREEGKNDTFHFQGLDFYINGKLQRDRITTPSFAEINHCMQNHRSALERLELVETDDATSMDGNEFFAYAVRTKRFDVIKLAYVKVLCSAPCCHSCHHGLPCGP